MTCVRCGLPQFALAGYIGPRCQCGWVGGITFNPPVEKPEYREGQTRPFVMLTEADVRRIVREELARAAAHPTDGAQT